MRLVIILIAALAFPTIANAQLPDDEVKRLAYAFAEAKKARQQPDTTVEDIDHFLSLLAEPFVDEHLKYDVVITDRAELREGMIRKMEDDIIKSDLSVDELLIGPNVAFVKISERVTLRRSPDENYFDYVGTSVISLEFNDDGLITRIRRHQ